MIRNRRVVSRTGTVNRNSGLYTGPLTEVEPSGHSSRKGRRPSGDKGAGEWAKPAHYFCPIERDSRWG